jgi:hypothetical protein
MRFLYLVLCISLTLPLLWQCSKDEAPTRDIRAHLTSHGGVMHGFPASLAPRYCSGCHGLSLTGGKGLEPSCYSCHGQRWDAIDGTLVRAPSDHDTAKMLPFTTYSAVKGTAYGVTYSHHPSLKTPEGTCTSCHGADLFGSSDGGLTVPSCFLCHAKRW